MREARQMGIAKKGISKVPTSTADGLLSNGIIIIYC